MFAGAPLVAAPRLRARLAELCPPGAYVVAADRGAETALACGYPPDLLIGDMDSIEPALLAELRSRPMEVNVLPRDKDATDGQLALEGALAIGPERLVLAGYLGGPRLDQELANVLLLTTLPVPAVLLDPHNEAVLLRGGERMQWAAEPGELVSLLPLSTNARGISTRGLRWSLEGAELPLGTTRGVSNEPVASEVSVSAEEGLVLVTRHFPPG